MSGSDGKLLDFIKNGTNRFVTGLSRKFYFIEVNDTNDFEASDGYILLGKSLDINLKEDGFAVKIRKNLPDEKLFLHPEKENILKDSYDKFQKSRSLPLNSSRRFACYIINNSIN